MPTIDSLVRALRRGPDPDAARAAEASAGAVAERAEDAARRRALAALLCRSGIPLGNTPHGGTTLAVTLPRALAQGLPCWILGSTGAGKTRQLAYLCLSDLLTPGTTLIAADFKGDPSGLAELLTDAIIPSVAVQLGPEKGSKLLSGLTVLAPWRNTRLPSLHLTGKATERAIVAGRALAVADVFASAIGRDDWGSRQLSLLLPCLRLLIRTGVPLPLLPDVLGLERLRGALLAVAQDEELQAYFSTRFSQDTREASASLLARLDRFLIDTTTRLAMFAPEPFDAANWFKGTTVLNFGGSAGGMHRAFWASFSLASIVRTIIARRPRRNDPRLCVRVDEASLGIGSPHDADLLDEALSVFRSKRAAITLAHQHPGQLSSARLQESLRTNAGAFFCFRLSEVSLGAAAMMLPESLPFGVDAQDLSPAQVAAVWGRVVRGLPDRAYLLRVPALSSETIPVIAPRFEPELFRRGVPEEVLRIAREGAHGYDRAALEAAEDNWRRIARAIDQAQAPNLTAVADAGAAPRGCRRRAAAWGMG